MTNLYKGDDLMNVIQVNRPTGTSELAITRCEVQVGCHLFTKDNPTFPYMISIPRDKSIDLNYQNPIFMRIYFSNNEVRRTCVGTLTLAVNEQVVNG